MSEHNLKFQALQLFDTLVELPERDRELRLLALTQQAPELAQEVQRLLAADAANSGLLDHGVENVAQTFITALHTDDAIGGLRPGALVGGFKLMRPIGVGGMGEVWLAERRVAQADGDFVQHVALKLLKRGMDSELLVRRFLQERRILAELNHPHIARFIDGGITVDGRLYYAMEFVEGVSMLDYARQKKLGVRGCVALMIEICDAVAHAQAHLVVHRDLKPSNILVDDHNQPRVLDFGIAKLIDSSDPNQTASEMRAMTPVYAAPEQILGEAISTATDVYALGVILYQLLTGTLPNQRSGTLASLADEVRKETIERPSVALRRAAQTHSGQTTQLDPVRAARELVGDLDTILLMALRLEPARRYANAAAFGNDLRAWLAGMPVAAQLDTRGYRVRTFVRRNRAMVGGASAVFLALLAGLSVALWQAGVARGQALRAEKAALKATEVNRFFVGRLENRRNASADLLMRDWIAESLPALKTDLANSPEARAEVGVSLATSLSILGQKREAIRAFDTAIAELEALHYDGALPTRASALQARASANLDLDNQAAAERDLQASMALIDQIPNQTDAVKLTRISARTTLLRLANAHGDSRQALAIGQANLADRIALLGANAPALAVDYHNISTTQSMLGDYDGAERGAKRALELLALGTDSGARSSFVYNTLFVVEMGRGNLAEARRALTKVREMRELHMPPGHPDILVCASFESLLDLLELNPNRAEQRLLPAMDTLKDSQSSYYPILLYRAAQVYLVQNRASEALRLADEASKLPAHPSLHMQRLNLVRTVALARLAQPGQASQRLAQTAVEQARQATEVMFADSNTSPLYQGDDAVYLAEAFRTLGDQGRADEWRAKGIAHYQLSMSPERALSRAKALIGR